MKDQMPHRVYKVQDQLRVMTRYATWKNGSNFPANALTDQKKKSKTPRSHLDLMQISDGGVHDSFARSWHVYNRLQKTKSSGNIRSGGVIRELLQNPTITQTGFMDTFDGS